MPDNFDRVVPDVAAFLQRLCSRFGIRMDTWSLHLGVRVQLDADGYVLSCNGMSACEALAAVAVTPLDIRLTVVALGAAGADALAPMLGMIAHLTSLDLGGLSLGAAGLASLAPALSKMTKLVSLDLAGNNLEAAGAATLAPALAAMMRLESLGLGANALGPGGAASLAPALSQKTKLV